MFWIKSMGESLGRLGGKLLCTDCCKPENGEVDNLPTDSLDAAIGGVSYNTWSTAKWVGAGFGALFFCSFLGMGIYCIVVKRAVYAIWAFSFGGCMSCVLCSGSLSAANEEQNTMETLLNDRAESHMGRPHMV
jgi:hypothetical protein